MEGKSFKISMRGVGETHRFRNTGIISDREALKVYPQEVLDVIMKMHVCETTTIVAGFYEFKVQCMLCIEPMHGPIEL